MMKLVHNLKYLDFALVFMAFLAACSSPTPQIIEVTREVPSTVVVTEIITQVVTPEPSPTPSPTIPPPTATSAPAQSLAPTSSIPVYQPIEDCPGSLVAVGVYVRVSTIGGSNAIRSTPNLASAAIIGYALPGEPLHIIGGPVCSYGWLVWMVETSYGLQGWTPETDGKEWWLTPVAFDSIEWGVP
jgi:hypothetical protein